MTLTRHGLRERFGDQIVVKPLGVSHFADDDSIFKVVHAQDLDSDDVRLDKLPGAPFIIQQRVKAVWHLRVVTVRDQVVASASSS